MTTSILFLWADANLRFQQILHIIFYRLIWFKIQTPLRKRRRRVLSISDTSDIELENAVPSTSGHTASLPVSSTVSIPYTEFPGLDSRVVREMIDKTPADFYHFLVPDEVFEMVADYTNSFAIKKVTGSDAASKAARIR